MQSIIFLDVEGASTQELAAVEMDCISRVIVDYFHGFAPPKTPDGFAMYHVHGLNFNVIEEDLYPSETSLLDAFKLWLCKKDGAKIYANDSYKEEKALNIKINNFALAPWVERRHVNSHIVAQR